MATLLTKNSKRLLLKTFATWRISFNEVSIKGILASKALFLNASASSAAGVNDWNTMSPTS